MARRGRLLLRLTVIALVGGAILAAMPWVSRGIAGMSREQARRWTTGALVAGLIAYLAIGLAAPIVGTVAMARIRSARRRGKPTTRAARVLLLSVAAVAGLAVVEAAASWLWSRDHRLPTLPTRFEDDGAAARPLRVVTVGESSAEGVPYEQWLSTARIVAWQLERVFPGRASEVEVVARGGMALDIAFPGLTYLKHRPDVVLVFAGHNEFQAHFSWDRSVPYYEDGPGESFWTAAIRSLSRLSSIARLVREGLEKQRLDAPPPPKVTRHAVDVPCCTEEEGDDRLEQYRRRLDAIASWCGAIGAVPVFVVPASNNGGFEPNRSILPRRTTRAERDAFARRLSAARSREARDPAASAASYRTMIAEYPGFAEAHYRLARVCERLGSWGEARDHDRMARDLDAMPQRCPSRFQEALRRVARDHGAILVDGPEVLRAESPHGLLDDHLFHDAHHPTLAGYAALARDALRQMRDRRSLGWPEATPMPAFGAVECASHFRVGRREWVEVYRKSAQWYAGEAYLRYDPLARLSQARRNYRVSLRLLAGDDPADVPEVRTALQPREGEPITAPSRARRPPPPDD